MATQLPYLPEVERLSSRVIRILAGNPGKFTLQGTNTYLIGTGSRRLLIDTGEGKDSWIKALSQTLKEENATVSDTLLTHWHGDHVGGIKQLKSMLPEVKFHKHRHDFEDNLKEDMSHEIEDGQTFKVEGAMLKAIHCPGHTEDHMALILQEENAMFTGDNVLGHGTAVFQDLGVYLASLDKMRRRWLEAANEKEGGKAYPGHGAVVEDGKGKILEYIAHRKQREEEVLTLLKSGRSEHSFGASGRSALDGTSGGRDDEWTSMELVKIIYKDVPESLHIPAEMGVIQVLSKLQEEGKIEEMDNERWRLKGREKL